MTNDDNARWQQWGDNDCKKGKNDDNDLMATDGKAIMDKGNDNYGDSDGHQQQWNRQ